MGKVVDLTGRVFGRLTVRTFVGLTRTKESKRAQWACDCACGEKSMVQATSLVQGKQVSCGCLAREKSSQRAQIRNQNQNGSLNRNFRHGHNREKFNTPTYRAWSGMLTRARNPHANKAYKDVGVSDRWQGKHGFETFLLDMGERPSVKCSLSRRLDCGDYTPGNVDWGTIADQRAEGYGKKAMQLLHAYNLGFEAGQRTCGRAA